MDVFAALEEVARGLLDRAYVPYSGRPAACVILLSDGALVPGVRVENASYSLTIRPAVAGVATAHAMDRRDVQAALVWPRAEPSEVAYLSTLGLSPLSSGQAGSRFIADGAPLPPPLDLLPLSATGDASDPSASLERARSMRTCAFVPESSFAVGCVVRTSRGFVVPGVNVEHPDWTYVLCAERTALAAARAYDAGAVTALYLSAGSTRFCTPCGTCRQVILELAPNSVLWMDRNGTAHGPATPDSLLPDAFVL